MYGQDICIKRFVVYWQLNIYELLDLQARKCFWNAPWAANQYKIAIFY